MRIRFKKWELCVRIFKNLIRASLGGNFKKPNKSLSEVRIFKNLIKFSLGENSLKLRTLCENFKTPIKTPWVRIH